LIGMATDTTVDDALRLLFIRCDGTSTGKVPKRELIEAFEKDSELTSRLVLKDGSRLERCSESLLSWNEFLNWVKRSAKQIHVWQDGFTEAPDIDVPTGPRSGRVSPPLPVRSTSFDTFSPETKDGRWSRPQAQSLPPVKLPLPGALTPSRRPNIKELSRQISNDVLMSPVCSPRQNADETYSTPEARRGALRSPRASSADSDIHLVQSLLLSPSVRDLRSPLALSVAADNPVQEGLRSPRASSVDADNIFQEVERWREVRRDSLGARSASSSTSMGALMVDQKLNEYPVGDKKLNESQWEFMKNGMHQIKSVVNAMTLLKTEMQNLKMACEEQKHAYATSVRRIGEEQSSKLEAVCGQLQSIQSEVNAAKGLQQSGTPGGAKEDPAAIARLQRYEAIYCSDKKNRGEFEASTAERFRTLQLQIAETEARILQVVDTRIEQSEQKQRTSEQRLKAHFEEMARHVVSDRVMETMNRLVPTLVRNAVDESAQLLQRQFQNLDSQVEELRRQQPPAHQSKALISSIANEAVNDALDQCAPGWYKMDERRAQLQEQVASFEARLTELAQKDVPKADVAASNFQHRLNMTIALHGKSDFNRAEIRASRGRNKSPDSRPSQKSPEQHDLNLSDNGTSNGQSLSPLLFAAEQHSNLSFSRASCMQSPANDLQVTVSEKAISEHASRSPRYAFTVYDGVGTANRWLCLCSGLFGKWTVVPRCPQGAHPLVEHYATSTDWYCSVCSKFVHFGFSLYRCKRCDYDECDECHVERVQEMYISEMERKKKSPFENMRSLGGVESIAASMVQEAHNQHEASKIKSMADAVSDAVPKLNLARATHEQLAQSAGHIWMHKTIPQPATATLQLPPLLSSEPATPQLSPLLSSAYTPLQAPSPCEDDTSVSDSALDRLIGGTTPWAMSRYDTANDSEPTRSAKKTLRVWEDEELQLPENAVIIRAWFGPPGNDWTQVGGGFDDNQTWAPNLIQGVFVTDIVRDKAKRSRNVMATRRYFGDPAKGIKKVLLVEIAADQEAAADDRPRVLSISGE